MKTKAANAPQVTRHGAPVPAGKFIGYLADIAGLLTANGGPAVRQYLVFDGRQFSVLTFSDDAQAQQYARMIDAEMVDCASAIAAKLGAR